MNACQIKGKEEFNFDATNRKDNSFINLNFGNTVSYE